MYDVAIIGAGPAGLSAAVALACEGKSVVLLEKSASVGGQIGHSHLVENVVRSFSGEEFAEEALDQALMLGVDVMLGQEVMILSGVLGNFSLVTPYQTFRSRVVLVTVGVSPKDLPFEVPAEGCNCKVVQDPGLVPASAGEHVLVYGGGNSAGQAACYYAKQGCEVTILSRRPLEETMDARWIGTLTGLGVIRLAGEIARVQNDTVMFESNGYIQHITPHTLHSFLGGTPITSWLVGVVDVDEQGYIITDDQHCTATPGVYAAGDCVSGSIKRFNCAVGGATEAVHSLQSLTRHVIL